MSLILWVLLAASLSSVPAYVIVVRKLVLDEMRNRRKKFLFQTFTAREFNANSNSDIKEADGESKAWAAVGYMSNARRVALRNAGISPEGARKRAAKVLSMNDLAVMSALSDEHFLTV